MLTIAQTSAPMLALSVTTLLGYIAGIYARPRGSRTIVKARNELKRARTLVRELDRISLAVRANIDMHEMSLNYE